jgi:hypothetical protein
LCLAAEARRAFGPCGHSPLRQVRREGDEGAGEPPLPPSLRWLAIEENEGAAPQESPTSRLRAQGIEVEFIEGAVVLIAEEGFDPEFGARGP